MSRGLSSANFVTGAMDGYRFMSGVENDKLRKEEIHANRGLRDAESARRAEDHAMRKTEHEAVKQIQGIRMNELNDEKIAKMNKAAAWSLYNAKDMPEEYQSLVAAHPNLDFNRLTSEEAGKHEKTIDALMNGDIEMTDPAVAEAMDFLNPEIGLGSGGGRKVKTSRLYPGKNPGTVMVGLSVEGDDRIRPLTERRSADDDDPVREIPVEMLLERAQIFKDTRRMLADPKGRDWFIKTNLPELAKSQQVSAKDQSMIDKNNAMTELYKAKAGTEKAGGGGASGRDPADIRSATMLQEKFKAEGKDLTFEDAYTRVRTAVSNPEKYVSDYVKTEIESQKTITPSQRKDRKSLEREALESYYQLRKQLDGSQGETAAQPPAALPEMPPPTDHAGKIVRDTETGKRYKSDGSAWVEIN